MCIRDSFRVPLQMVLMLLCTPDVIRQRQHFHNDFIPVLPAVNKGSCFFQMYQSTLNAFMLFCKTDAIRFNQMERSRLKQFENHLRNKGCTWNTVSTYMRTLRSIYNKAVDDGLAEEKPPPISSKFRYFAIY